MFRYWVKSIWWSFKIFIDPWQPKVCSIRQRSSRIDAKAKTDERNLKIRWEIKRISFNWLKYWNQSNWGLPLEVEKTVDPEHE
jgi:hypothetical protein